MERGARMHPGRRFAIAAAVLVAGLIPAGWVSVDAGAQSGGSVLDGVFTEAQATRGEATFRRVCAACHDTGEFSGGRFRLTWVGQSAGDLYDTIATLMPEGDPGSLTPAQYAGVVAYLLQLNGYPAGEADLPTSLSALRGLEIVSAP
jgi:mono/diheme cytochrome c family protein